MRLSANMVVEERYGETLAEIEVESDTVKQVYESFHRHITGTITKFGPIWGCWLGVLRLGVRVAAVEAVLPLNCALKSP